MSEVEHYFENLIHFGKDVEDNVNKDFLSKEVQEAVEECALYIKSLLGLGILSYTDVKPTQPEPLTDKEQRIFLAAMAREEKVCKQVDIEYRNCRESYEDSLVRTCHEITRKVKGALWTT